MEKKKYIGREELKKYFRNGNIPSENHFSYLIDSMINKQDDGFSKDTDYGLHISPAETSRRLLTFYSNIDELQPFFCFEKNPGGIPALKLQPCSGETGGEEGENTFFFHHEGKLGIGKLCDEKHKLEVKGFIGMEGRIGTHKTGTVPADGDWHPILSNLDNCQAFEIIARAGNKGSGKFSIMHAIALSTYGRSSSRIRKTRAHFGFFWNRLNLRWKSYSTHQYELQLRTSNNYGTDGNGEPVKIHYAVTRLWDDEQMLPADYFYAPHPGNK